MADRPVVAVVGATGAQGQGVVDALLKQGRYQIRGLTRDVSSQKARGLASKGVDVVEANLTDHASLVKAFAGATFVFLVTDCGSASMNPHHEFQQGKTAADAAKEAGVKHIVFSGLEDFRSELPPDHGLVELKEFPGHYMAHMEAKAQIWDYIRKLGLPATQLVTCCYYENFAGWSGYQPQGDGSLVLSYPTASDAKVPMHAAGDIGASAAVVLEEPSKYVGATIPVVADSLTMPEVADTLSSVTGTKVSYQPMPHPQMAGMPFPGAVDFANMMHFYNLPVLAKHRSVDRTVFRGLSFREWAERNKEALSAHLQKCARHTSHAS